MSEAAPTAYDAVAYPSAIFSQTAPDRLATIARLAGLSPPPIAGARVLEIGAGDGMNLLALAAAWPQAHFTGFDLAPTAVARGERWRALAGIENAELRVLDILTAADHLEGPYDYIVAHGVYTWVDAAAQADLIRFVDRHLKPGGLLAIAIATELEAYDGGPPLPPPDVGREDGWTYISQPVAIRVDEERAKIERIRQLVSPDDQRTTTEDEIVLYRVTPGGLAEEAAVHGLEAEELRHIPETLEHVASQVVLFRG